MLKKKFPSLTSIGSDGNTAFLRAARAGHLDKVLDQLKNNVDINTSNANGLNALHLASKDGHIQVVDLLLKKGANVDSATKKGNTALHIASLAGQEEVVRRLVESGACVNVQSQNGFTPLYMAAQENHDAVVRFLLASGANQSLATEDGFTPLAVAMQQGHDKVVAVLLENDTRGKVRLPALHIAAKKDDCKAAALLLQNEHNPDVTSKSGFTPLHIAAHYGNEGIANLLLSKGADVNFAAKHNITPLHVAAKWGKANMVAVLLSKGANIEAKTRDGLTPLHCAARSGHEQVVDMLLERGAPISAKTKNGLAALHMSSQGDHVDAARILLYHRAPVDDVTVDYLTALHVAAHCGHVGVARLLLDRKADPNARALNGFTPLHIACKKNRIKVVELLLKHGASIEATTESGLTPLHVASFMGCMNIVIYLVQNEAHPDVKTVRGETPLHLAARANQTDIIRILLRNGAQVDARAREEQTPLHIASRLGNVDIVMLLLQHGAGVDSTTKDLYTALHIAAKEGQDEVASVLLENGASLEATTKKGFTPLHLAAKYGNMNVAKLLLRREAPVDAQGKNGVTPLHVASHYDHQNVALLLLEKGASPHATAKNGHTPLHIAARKNQMDIATTLLEYGAKANAESKAGFTPLHLSAQEGHSEMSSLLIEHQAEVNHKAKNGLSPLHLCAQEDRVEVATILIKNEAQVDTTTKAGYTPLHVASHFGQMGMVKLLLANGASANAVTTVNYTPLHQAAQQGHSTIVAALLDAGADPNAQTNQGQTGLSIAQKLGYISVVETLKAVTDSPISPTPSEEKYKVVSPETMQETFMSDSEDEGGDVLGLEYGFSPAHPHVYLPYFRGDSIFTREDTMLSEQPYHYLTVDEMKGLGDDSLPIDVTRDERDNRDNIGPPTAIDDTVSPQHIKETYTQFHMADNIDIGKHPQQVGFLVSFLVDARGGAMRGCRHSGVRVIVPPRRAAMPLRVTCRYLKRDKLPHPPPLMEGEALASRILELGPVGAKFLGPVMIEVPHFGSLRGKEREMVILRSDNGETWREHTFEATDEAIQEIVSHSFDNEEMAGLDDSARTTRILTTEFPHYIAVVSRVRQEVHAIGPEGGMVSSTVVPQVQAVFPQGALTKKIKVGLQAQPIPAELTAKLLGNRVAVSPIVTVEPRRRKFHKPISLTIPVPQAANKGMINQYSGEAPTLRLLCSITGGTTRAQWEDVTGSTPLTFVNDCVSFTTTVSARFWLMDCRNVSDATKMATELYKEAIHVPFMAKFVVFAKRVDTTEARLRVFCMTDDKEDKTLEHQEHFTEVAKSRDVEVLEGKMQYLEFAGNLIPVTKSGDQPKLGFRAFKENRLPFTVRVKDPHADAIGRIIFMREPKVAKGDVPQQPICILNIVLPEDIIPEPDVPETESHKHSYITHTSGLQRLSDISNLLGEDWVRLASELGVSPSEVNNIKSELCECSVEHQGLAMLRLWLQGNKSTGAQLEEALRRIGRDDILAQAVFNSDESAVLSEELSPSYTTTHNIFRRATIDRGIKESAVIIESQEKKKAGLEKDDDEKKYTAEEKVIGEKVRKDAMKEDIVRGEIHIQEKITLEKITQEKVAEERLKEDKLLGKKEEKVEEKLKECKIVEDKPKGGKDTEEKLKEQKFVEGKLEEDKVIEGKSKEERMAEEEEEFKKSVLERRKDIEKRLSQEIDDKKKVVPKETKSILRQKEKKPSEDLPEKETAEEKAVSPEPAHLSFEEKRKSFELGITPKPAQTQVDVTHKFIAEERKQEVMVHKPPEQQEEEKEEQEEQLSFQEKRRSFEKGLSMKKPGDKLPAADRLKEKEIDKKTEEKRLLDHRRDSELFEEVSQGLDRIEKGVVKPHHEILSPMVVKTPPPSPADFSKETQDNKKWSMDEKLSPTFYTTPERKETTIIPTKPSIIEDIETIKMESERCESAYDNLGGFYREMKEGVVYPPHLGYSEFTTSSSSLGFETETFSELFFSSSEEEDSKADFLLGPETPGILYKISRQLDKVPRYISTRKQAEEEREDFLDMTEDTEELISLQDSVENMITNISNEEKLFFSNKSECLIPVKMNFSESNKNLIQDCSGFDPVHSLSVIENEISNLIKEVEREEKEIMKQIKDNRESVLVASPGDRCYDPEYYSSSDSSEELDMPRISLRVGKKFGKSTVDISTSGGPLKKTYMNRSLPDMSRRLSLPCHDLFHDERMYPSSSIEYITPTKGVGFVNSGYCIWTSDEDLLDEGSVETTIEEKSPAVIHRNGITTEKEIKSDIVKTTDEIKQTISPQILDRSVDQLTSTKTEIVFENQKLSGLTTLTKNGSKTVSDSTHDSIEKTELDRTEKSSKEQIPESTKHCKEYKHALEEEIKEMEYAPPLDEDKPQIQSEEDIDRMIKERESQMVESDSISEEREEDSPKPIITTPSTSRRGLGGSQRLSREERPTVRIVTDFAEDSTEEEEEETSYYVTEPVEKQKRRNVKFRFDSGDYRDDEESDKEIEEKAKTVAVEKKFERMASETKESELEKSDGEFQQMVSQLSVEEMDEALHLWDKGGLTPSDLDSKSLTEPSDETSPQGFESNIFKTNLSAILPTTFFGGGPLLFSKMENRNFPPLDIKDENHTDQSLIINKRGDGNNYSPTGTSDNYHDKEGNQALEEEGAKGAPPPIPSPRSHSTPSEPSLETEDHQNYASKKMFWEQVSTGSTEKPPESLADKPPVPKPRLSITASMEKSDYYETSPKGEVLEIDKTPQLPEATPTAAVARGISKEESLDDSEMEYIQTHKDELSYDNDAFDLDDSVESLCDFSAKKKPIYERSVSLPCDTTADPSTSSVRTKKRMFEAQIKKEMVVEQLMSQLEEESSPEHKCIKQKSEKPKTDTQAMVTRQIHTDIFSDEMDQQIDSLVPENKELRQPIGDKDAETSSPDTSISSSIAEVLHYKNDVISKPSDSLEVHVDKSETEGTEKEKELDEDLKVLEDSRLQAPFPKDKAKIGSVTSSQGESEDTFSESDVTPEDTRFKEQQDIQDWGSQEMKLDKKPRSIYTPEEHLPDTVWEVPVQESTDNLQEETVQQLPAELVLNITKKSLTESEARELAKEIVEDIEVEICKREAKLLDSKLTELTDAKRPEEPFGVKYRRTDTTTSSMDITDEDLRCSAIESDISPLESQAGHVFKDDLSEGDSSEDVDNIDLGRETPGEDVLERTLAEVKESLEAVKEELIEEKKKKKDSITKESPSEFEFKVLSLENRFNESIKESRYEEGTIASESEKPADMSYKAGFKDKDTYEKSISSETKSDISLKHDMFDKSTLKSSQEKTDQQQEYLSKKTVIEEEGTQVIEGISLVKESHSTCSKTEEQTASDSHKVEETKVLSGDKASVSTVTTEESEKTAKSSESFGYDTVLEAKDESLKYQERQHKEESKKSEEENKKKVDIQSSEFVSDDGKVVMKITETSEITSLIKTETKEHTQKCIIEETQHMVSEFSGDDRSYDSDKKEDSNSDALKSPIHEDLSTSSSSEVKASSDTSASKDKPSIVIRKHSKSTVSKLHGEIQSDPYSSSGESHYHSFEQTSDSLRTPGSRPLSSDVEGLVANLTGVTGSSEYESAVSGQSTTVTSRDYRTAVSSLSSRDSMKSLDSESSGNLASASSEASETLVPSAMELEEMDGKPSQAQYKVESPVKAQSISESNGQSVSFDISTEEMSEDEAEPPSHEVTQKMKRSHEMTFQPEPRPIVEERLSSSVDDVVSVVSDSTAVRTVIELSRTESDKMDGSATSDQLTVSGTSDQLSFSESKDTESTMETRIGSFSTQFSEQHSADLESDKVATASGVDKSFSTEIPSRSAVHTNGPTQVDYNVEYDEVESEVKKRPGHRRNGSTSFRASMIPIFQGYEFEKKSEDILEDTAESDKYTQSLTSKEGSQEEKKDIDEAEKLEDEFYQTEADQGFHRDMREGRVVMKETSEFEEGKELEIKSRLSSVAYSEDRPDSEIAELLKQCSTDVTEDPIERPKTPEPVEECEIKDDTPEFSSEAQASVTELEMEYSGAFSRSSEYEAHVSPIREKGLLWQEEAELAEAEAAFQEPHFTSLQEIIQEDPFAEKHELETQELSLKEEMLDRTSPVPGITITQHMTPVLDESFVFPDTGECAGSVQQMTESISSRASSETSMAGKEYILETATTKSIVSDDMVDEVSHTTDEKTVFEKDTSKEIESGSDSPTSDSFELLEKPDLADEFVIIEEVGKEAHEQDREGKSVKIVGKRISYTQRQPEKDVVTSPPTTSAKMTKIKYYTKGGEEEPFEFESETPPKAADEKTGDSSQEGSPPSAIDDDFKPEVEAGKKWIEMQFQGVEPVAPIYGYDVGYERGPLEDIKEEDLNDLESSSKIGSMGSQVSHSIGSFGSVKESLSSTPDYDVLAGRKFFTRSGEHDDISMSSLQEFERLENLIALESTKHKSLGSQDSLTSSSNSKKHGSRSGGDDISLASLKEFEGLESACIAAERIEKKAKAEEESLLSEIEEGHESQASESESCVTVSVSGLNRDSDEDDYEKRMFEIDEIIRQAQTNVEQFMDAKGKEHEKKKSESLGHADSLEEMTKVPDLDFDQPTVSQSKTYCGKTYITQWEDLGEELLTSTDSLELKTQISKASLADPFTTSTDSLEIKFSQDVMSVSTDSIEAAQKKKTTTIMTDSIEIGEKSSMITSTDSLEEKITQANSLEEEEPQGYSSSSGKEVDWSGSGKDESYDGSVNRMPPPRAEYMLGSTDSLEPTSSTATHATYQYETDSVMSSSFTSGDSTTMVDEDGEARAGIWFEEGKPYVTEVIEPGDDEFSQIIHRTVEMPPKITKVSFKGEDADKALREYIEKFDPGEDISETRDIDSSGNVHIKRVVQKRIVIRPEEMGGDTTDLKGEDLEQYLKSLTQSQFPDQPSPESTETYAQYSSQWTVSQTQGERIKSEQEEKAMTDSRQRGARPPLKYDISVDEEPEFDPREHDWRYNLHTHLERDEDLHSDSPDGYSMEQKGPSQPEQPKK